MGSVCMFRYWVFLKQGDNANGCMLQVNIFLGEEEDCGEEKMAGEAGGGFGLHSDRVATLELKQNKKKQSIHEG